MPDYCAQYELLFTKPGTNTYFHKRTKNAGRNYPVNLCQSGYNIVIDILIFIIL